MLYFILKYLHIIGAAVLLGTGAGIAFFMLAAHLDGKPAVIAGVARIVVIADFIFTATAVIAQPITGSPLALQAGYSLREGWIVWSIVLYLFTGVFWLPVVGCKYACAIWLPKRPNPALLCLTNITASFGIGAPLEFPRSSRSPSYSG